MDMELPFPLIVRGLGQLGRPRKRAGFDRNKNIGTENENKALAEENKLCTYCGIEDPR
jgi:hypothetical protein